MFSLFKTQEKIGFPHLLAEFFAYYAVIQTHNTLRLVSSVIVIAFELNCHVQQQQQQKNKELS